MTDLAREIDLLRDAISEMAERHDLELETARKIAREAVIDKRFLQDDVKELKTCLNEAIATHLEEGCDPNDGWLLWAKSLVKK